MILSTPLGREDIIKMVSGQPKPPHYSHKKG